MLFKQIDKIDILKEVMKAVEQAKKEVIATMLLSEDLENPLPASYHRLLKRKISEGVLLKRLGFGTRGDYNEINRLITMPSPSYDFRYVSHVSAYQRLLIVDRKTAFFSIDGLFFQSSYKPLVEMFVDYFNKQFRKGKR